jgi:hypothetical protein
MLRKIITIFAFVFLMAITVPVLAQRYDSCGIRGHARGHQKHRYEQRYDRGNMDYGRSRRNYNRGYNSYNRGYSNGGYNNGYYAPAYNQQRYYVPNSYYVVRRPVRRVYRDYGYRPRYRSRNRISFSIGF